MKAHVKDLLKKASCKVDAQAKFTPCMGLWKKIFLTVFSNPDLTSVLWHGCTTYAD